MLPIQNKILLLIGFCLLLSGCNGHSTSENINNTIKTDERIIVNGDSDLFAGQGVELILYFPEDTLTNITWHQISGDPINLLAKNTKVIAFTPKQAGNYSFEASFSVNGSANQVLTESFTVKENTDNKPYKVTGRLGHAVLSQNKVSLRVEIDASIDTSTITWQQISGPRVQFTENDVTGDLAIFFDAPNINKDSLVTIKVTASDNTQSYSDFITILVEQAPLIASNAYFDERVAHVFPYQNKSQYAANIVNCVYSNELRSSCTLGMLPLLAHESSTPNIGNIMDRVVVSHTWMGDKFKQFLENNDNNDDFKRLLRATTAIVISYDIRPSFYWAATGAIYLDAENFWLSPEERDTINEAPDYRADFGKDLQFVMPWRYVKDNNYASKRFEKSQRVERTEADALYRLSSLLYHELAHANDFLPSNEWFIHSDQTRVLDAATIDKNLESDNLTISLPLQSAEMRKLARISFHGETANSTQKSYTPSDIESFFSTDVATDYYAFSSEREDYAMLFEELMMKVRFGVVRDVAITNQPTGDIIYANDYIVTWGQRGRLTEQAIKPRVIFSASRVLPEFNSANAIELIPSPIMMTAGDNWIENLNISPTKINIEPMQRTKQQIETHKTYPTVQYQPPYFHKELPKH